MKLLKKALEKGGLGEITLMPEEPEDMWHAYNLIAAGDRLRATTVRKVQREGVTGSVDSQKVRTTLCIRVIKVDFDTEACQLRVKGKNVEENKYVKLGQHHTIDMELNRKFTLIKDEWDSVALDRVELACDPARTADVAAVIMDEGIAYLALLTSSMTIVRAKIEVSIPKKRPMNISQRQKAMQRFYDQVSEAIQRHVDFAVVKVILVASPGFVKDEFLKRMWEEAVRRDNKELQTNKPKFLPVHSSSGHLHDLKEILSDSSISSKLADTKAAAEVQALEVFLKTLHDDPDRAFYGFNHVRHACDANAIDTLLVSDSLFRSNDIRERRKYVKLVDDVREGGGTVRIFSSLHVSGQQLDQLSGVAALLRFPLPDVDVEADSEDSDSDSD